MLSWSVPKTTSQETTPSKKSWETLFLAQDAEVPQFNSLTLGGFHPGRKICDSIQSSDGQVFKEAGPFHYAIVLSHSNSSSPATFHCSEQTASLLWKTSLSFLPSEEVTSPGHQGDRALLGSLPLMGTVKSQIHLTACCFSAAHLRVPLSHNCFMQRLTTPHTSCVGRSGTKSCASVFFQEMCLKARHS